jgi:TolB protein
MARPSVLKVATLACSLSIAGCSPARSPHAMPTPGPDGSSTTSGIAEPTPSSVEQPLVEQASGAHRPGATRISTVGPATSRPTGTVSGSASQRLRNGLIAFSATDASGGSHVQVFVTDSTGRSRRQLTVDGDNEFPAWSPTGTEIIFSSNRNGHFEIYKMHADGSHQALVPISGPSDQMLPRLAPDQARIAFAGSEGASSHLEIWIVPSSGGDSRRLTSTPPGAPPLTWSNFPRFSPDGKKLLYSSTASGTSQVWIMDADGTHQRRLTSGFGPDYPDANAPNWSPAGDRIVFWAGHEGLYGDVWTMYADGSRPVRLTHEPNPVSSDNPFWSPDAQQILFDTNRGQKPEMWVMGADGSGQRRLLDLGSGNNQFSWQPVFDG